jgi:hypothetical protein
MSDNDIALKRQKLEMWEKRLVQLEKDYTDAIQRKGAAAREGDLSENYAYKEAIESAELAIARKTDVIKIITDLRKELGITDKKSSAV